MKKKPFISIIIPTLNEEQYLGTVLKALQQQTFQDLEIIVADGNSTDKTRKIAEKAGVKIVNGGRIAEGRNKGAEVAKGEILLFLDADVKLTPDFLQEGLVSFQNLDADLACCYFNTQGFGPDMQLVYWIWNKGKELRYNTKFPDGEGQCLWIKKTVFDAIGRFNETVSIGEDVELIHRAVKQGFRYTVLPLEFTPSTRRYRKIGMIRIFLGTVISGLALMAGFRRGGQVYEKMYGGWGNHTPKGNI